MRPGRPEPEAQDETDEPTYTDHDPSAPPGPLTGTPDASGAASSAAADPAASLAASKNPAVTARGPAASEPVVEILPLGSGLVLVGTGLALALLALRLRRE